MASETMTQKERWAAKADRYEAWADSADAEAARLYSLGASSMRGDIAFLTQPGRIPERTRMYERDLRAFELSKKAAGHREKAKSLRQMAARNKGDAARKFDAIAAMPVEVGQMVDTIFYGLRRVTKVNAKSVRVEGLGFSIQRGLINVQP